MDGCISVFVSLFFNLSMRSYAKYIFLHLTWFLYAGVHFLQFFNALTYSPITTFFKRLKFEESFPKILISRHLMQQKRTH